MQMTNYDQLKACHCLSEIQKYARIHTCQLDANHGLLRWYIVLAMCTTKIAANNWTKHLFIAEKKKKK